MDFNGQYLTYSEYVSMGGDLNIMPFNLLEFKARKRIDERTRGRLINKENLPTEVKLCVFEMINILKTYEAFESHNKGVASESIDGYSISYMGDASMNLATKNNELENMMMTYLSTTVVDGNALLYLG